MFTRCVTLVHYFSDIRRKHVDVCYRYHGKSEKTIVGTVQHRTGRHTDQREDIRRYNELPRERPESLAEGNNICADKLHLLIKYRASNDDFVSTILKLINNIYNGNEKQIIKDGYRRILNKRRIWLLEKDVYATGNSFSEPCEIYQIK